jgi:hypothetical protein
MAGMAGAFVGHRHLQRRKGGGQPGTDSICDTHAALFNATRGGGQDVGRPDKVKQFVSLSFTARTP